MPISPELRAFLAHQQALEESERCDLVKIPRIAVPDSTTLADLSDAAHWHHIDVLLAERGIPKEERDDIRHVITGIAEVMLPIGVIHHLTVEEVRLLSDEELLLLEEAHATIDSRGVAILRKLFGSVDEPTPLA